MISYFIWQMIKPTELALKCELNLGVESTVGVVIVTTANWKLVKYWDSYLWLAATFYEGGLMADPCIFHHFIIIHVRPSRYGWEIRTLLTENCYIYLPSTMLGVQDYLQDKQHDHVFMK